MSRADLVAVALCLGLSGVAAGMTPVRKPPSHVVLEYRRLAGAERCPTRPALEAQVTDILGQGPFVRHASRTVRCTLRGAPNAIAARVELVDGRSSARSESASCRGPGTARSSGRRCVRHRAGASIRSPGPRAPPVATGRAMPSGPPPPLRFPRGRPRPGRGLGRGKRCLLDGAAGVWPGVSGHRTDRPGGVVSAPTPGHSAGRAPPAALALARPPDAPAGGGRCPTQEPRSGRAAAAVLDAGARLVDAGTRMIDAGMGPLEPVLDGGRRASRRRDDRGIGRPARCRDRGIGPRPATGARPRPPPARSGRRRRGRRGPVAAVVLLASPGGCFSWGRRLEHRLGGARRPMATGDGPRFGGGSVSTSLVTGALVGCARFGSWAACGLTLAGPLQRPGRGVRHSTGASAWHGLRRRQGTMGVAVRRHPAVSGYTSTACVNLVPPRLLVDSQAAWTTPPVSVWVGGGLFGRF